MKLSELKQLGEVVRVPTVAAEVEDETSLLALIHLRNGWCPICFYRVICEVDTHDRTVNNFQCVESTGHRWKYDYVNQTLDREP